MCLRGIVRSLAAVMVSVSSVICRSISCVSRVMLIGGRFSEMYCLYFAQSACLMSSMVM